MTMATLKKLPRDLITCDYVDNIEFSEKYAGYAEKDHSIAEALIPSLEKAATDGQNHKGYRAVTQALFESGFLSLGEGDFNLDKMMEHIYGAKCVNVIPSFLKLHDWLLSKGHTDHVGEQVPSRLYSVSKSSLVCFKCDSSFNTSQDKDAGCPKCTSVDNKSTWNSGGDNYFSAYQFSYELSDSSKFVIKQSPSKRERPAPQARVIIMERQSPMWAIVVKDSPFSNEPKTLTIVRLKINYSDEDRVEELLKLVKENKLTDNSEWSSLSSKKNYGVITTVKIESMACDRVYEPKAIENALFCLYNGVNSIND
jgi:hypothetical protein